jgi:hypothetical protein
MNDDDRQEIKKKKLKGEDRDKEHRKHQEEKEKRIAKQEQLGERKLHIS